MELDRGAAILFSEARAEWIRRVTSGLASNLLRWSSGPDSIGKRRGPLATWRDLPFHSISGGVYLSVFCALGLGWRLARTVGSKLWARTRISRRRGSQLHPCTGRADGFGSYLILRPRRGKYSADGMAPAIPGHNAILVLFGCLLALLGWLGLNSAGAILFTGGEPSGSVLIAINTVFSAAAAALTAALVTYIRFGKPDASLTANGWVGGLVASSACCAFVDPAEAVVIGSIAGAVIILSVEWIELHLKSTIPAEQSRSTPWEAFGGFWRLGFLVGSVSRS